MNQIYFEFWEKTHLRIIEAIHIEYEVFLQWGYIESNDEKRALEYEKYPEYRFLVGLAQDRIVAVVRNVFDNKSDIKKLFSPPQEISIFGLILLRKY